MEVKVAKTDSVVRIHMCRHDARRHGAVAAEHERAVARGESAGHAGSHPGHVVHHGADVLGAWIGGI